MVNVGIVGIGFMGLIHYLALQKVKNAKVTAIVSRNPKKRDGDWRGIQGNFGPSGTVMDLGNINRYENLDHLLNDPIVELVDICLPPSLHADSSIKAMRAGKHVLCEKPIAVLMQDAQLMVNEAKKTNKMLMIGQVLQFFPEYNYVKRIYDQGTYGCLLGGIFKRIISDPTWIQNFYDPTAVGGPLIDLHVHDAHFIRLICGMPEQVYSRGRMRNEVVEFLTSEFIYKGENAPLITTISGAISQQGRPFTHAFEVYFEDATLLFDYSTLEGKPFQSMPLTILVKDRKVVRPELSSGDPIDAFITELSNATEAVETGISSQLLDGVLARDALLLCHKQAESVKTGKAVTIHK
jgi:predicted dehydrogenase